MALIQYMMLAVPANCASASQLDLVRNTIVNHLHQCITSNVLVTCTTTITLLSTPPIKMAAE